MPSLPLEKNSFHIPDGTVLADPNFDEPSEIDLLIYTEFFYLLLSSGQIRVKGQSAAFQETCLCWIVAVRFSDNQILKHSHRTTCNFITFQELPIIWKLGVDSISNVMSEEEFACEAHYKTNVIRNELVRYCVKLPFNDEKDSLANSGNTALQRFYALEHRFEKDPALKEQYTECIQGYLQESHMTPISRKELINYGYYLRHHAVVKRSSLTTKRRVVFDGSAKTSSGTSLSDSLMVGPTIQEDLFSIITLFRSFLYALTSDIEQMYRQVQMSSEDSHFQKILWCQDPDEPIKTYCLNTVTFGTACAPFLAICTLHQLAEDEGESFPTASAIVKRDFYADDLLTGA